jgi:hypothetical protein
MTEEEKKARELVFKYERLVTSWDCYNDEILYLEYKVEDMKQCALIDIDNTIEALEYHSWQNRKQIEYYKTIRTHITEMK